MSVAHVIGAVVALVSTFGAIFLSYLLFRADNDTSKTKRLLTNCKLVYFALGGRAEAIRLALVLSKIPFTDSRLDFYQWLALEPSAPWGTLPFLELSDAAEPTLGQSRAILRFVAKGCGLYPADDVQAAHAEACLDGCDELLSVTVAHGKGLPTPEKEEKRKAACCKGGAIYEAILRIEALYERVGSEHSKFLFVDLTIADLCVFASIGHVTVRNPRVRASSSRLQAWRGSEVRLLTRLCGPTHCSDYLLLTAHSSLLTVYHSPLTTHHAPHTTHHSPHTTHRSLTTNSSHYSLTTHSHHPPIITYHSPLVTR